MLYLIFRDGKFKGFTGNKKELKAFLEDRKEQDFVIQKVSEEQVGPLMVNNKNIHLYQLNFYLEYQRLLFGYEANQLFDILSDRFTALHQLYLDINQALIHIKLDEKEQRGIRGFFHIIEMMSDDLMGLDTHAPFNEYFNIESIAKLIIRKN